MMDNARPERPRKHLTLHLGAFAKRANGAPQDPTARSVRSSFVTAEADFLAALPIIDDVTGQVCRRHRLSGAEADDFQSDVRLHFIEKNYDVLRRFEGRCALATYVTVVVQRVFLDWRNRTWGRWRPSSDAQRLGPAAILLERLVMRDGWSLDQALETMRVNHGITIDAATRRFGDGLSARPPARRMVEEDAASEVASAGPGADDKVLLSERDFLAKRVRSALDRALQSLPPIQRLIIRMRFDDRAPVSEIARALHLEQRPLYRTIEQLLKVVGMAMEADGISRGDIDALFDAPPVEWDDHQRVGGGRPAPAGEKRKGAS